MTRPYRFLLRNKVRDQLSRERWSELLIQSDHHAFPVCWWLITTRYENYVSLNLYYTTALLVWESRNRVRRNLWSREHQTRPGYLGTGQTSQWSDLTHLLRAMEYTSISKGCIFGLSQCIFWMRILMFSLIVLWSIWGPLNSEKTCPWFPHSSNVSHLDRYL